MPLTLRQVEDVCLVDEGSAQCCFLAENDLGKFNCLKLTSKRAGIEKEVAAFKKDEKAKGRDPKAADLPLGNNCKGYTFFRYKNQGYDMPT